MTRPSYESLPAPGWQQKVAARLQRLFPSEEAAYQTRIRIFRILAIADLLLALNYFAFRYTRSINAEALWFAIPLLAAETYSFIDTLLFILMMWRPQRRQPPPPPEEATVDVFITTYNEPVQLVRKTAAAALKIRYPHNTYVLDDGNRPEMRAACAEIGCGYITRGSEWLGKARHAKAGNVNNALMQTNGEFILILDADQIPHPDILHRTLGYFRDPQVAFVQTPQYFYNVPKGDPFGSQAPLFYGPIQQGKDGWNSAFFCGSNAVLRRDALMQLGLVTYVRDTEKRIRDMLNNLPIELYDRRSELPRRYREAAKEVAAAAETAVRSLREGGSLQDVLTNFQQAVREIQRSLVADDLAQIQSDLTELLQETDETNDDLQAVLQNGLIRLAGDLAQIAAPPAQAMGVDEAVMSAIQLDSDEALDINPLATISITEDMATAMRLHALGWKSIFHPEILAYGLAPEDLGAMLGQRLRWAAGTIQVMVHENPLRIAGLSLMQRLQYFTTIYSYFSGFFSLVYLVAPIIYLLTGVSPVISYAGEFLLRITPYLLVNQILFLFVAWGMQVVRGQQYSLALFPVWIQAVVTVLGGSKLTFNVTPKSRRTGVYLNLVLPQLLIAILLTFSSLYALFALAVGWRNDAAGVLVNIFWAMYDIWMLSVVIKAAVYRYEEPLPEHPPFYKRSFQD